MLTSQTGLLAFLDDHSFDFRLVEHEPVFTCAEAERKRPDLPGVSTKNLFLCDKKGRRFFLAVTTCEKEMDLGRLAEQFGERRLRFASEENLARLLGVGRGSVTVLGLINDGDHQVELWIDRDIWGNETFLCHPLVNTATLVLSKDALARFFELTGHDLHFFEAD